VQRTPIDEIPAREPIRRRCSGSSTRRWFGLGNQLRVAVSIDRRKLRPRGKDHGIDLPRIHRREALDGLGLLVNGLRLRGLIQEGLVKRVQEFGVCDRLHGWKRHPGVFGDPLGIVPAAIGSQRRGASSAPLLPPAPGRSGSRVPAWGRVRRRPVLRPGSAGPGSRETMRSEPSSVTPAPGGGRGDCRCSSGRPRPAFTHDLVARWNAISAPGRLNSSDILVPV
jgi:hypothetical protein